MSNTAGNFLSDGKQMVKVKSFGDALKLLIAESGKTYHDVANAVGCTKGDLKEWGKLKTDLTIYLSMFCNTEFPLLRRADFTRSSTDSFTVASTAVVSLDENLGRIYIGMGAMAAVYAVVAFALTAFLVYVLALGAGSTGVSSWNKFYTTAGRLEFIANHGDQSTPTSAVDLACQLSFAHARDIQVFDNHNYKHLGVPSRELMQDMRSLSSNLPVDLSDVLFRPVAPLRSFLSPRYDTLRSRQLFLHLFPVLRIRHNTPIGISNEVGYPTVDSDDGLVLLGRVGYLLFAEDRNEPLINVTRNCALLWLTDERTVEDSTDRTKFRKYHAGNTDAEYHTIRLGQRNFIASFSLPMRATCQLGKIPLPSNVKIDQRLPADIARHIGYPRFRSSEFRKLFDLIKSRRLTHTPAQVIQTLFLSAVPQGTKRVLPTKQPIRLFSSWVDSITKSSSL